MTKKTLLIIAGSTALVIILAFGLLYWFNRSPVAFLRTEVVSLVTDVQPKYLFAAGNDNLSEADNLSSPASVAVDDQGRIYATDTGHGKIRVYDANGQHLLDIGQKGTGEDQLLSPRGIAVQGDKLYVSDFEGKKVVVYGLDGQFRETLVANGQKPEDIGTIDPLGLALDSKGNLYISDVYGSRIVILDPSGNIVNSFGKPGDDSQSLSYANFLAVTKDGKIFVADSNHGEVKVFDPQGNLLYSFNGRVEGDNTTSPAPTEGDATAGQSQNKGSLLGLPRGIAVDDRDRVFVVDTFIHGMRIFDELGNPKLTYGERGTDENEFNFPNGLAVAGDRIYVADKGNNRIVVLQR